MTGDTPNRLAEIYSAALKLEPAHRAEFVRRACGPDGKLQAGVESLLAHENEVGSFLEKSAAQVVSKSMLQDSVIGQMLGPYQIEALLGAGGMGQVYRAKDTRLGRAVAIKLAASEFSGRFLTEARAVAALNHPHVCTLFDIGPNYLVMELLEGDTLSARLATSALPLRQILQYGGEMADALAAAHARGIIHRDLKPGNIMITKAGVKLLDFGLAKLPQPAGAAAFGVDLTAEQEQRTHPGSLVGTVAYMSPEQARGEELDARTDLFSLGVVLYEMATGNRPFGGKTNAVIFEWLLNRPPKLVREWNPGLPPKLDQIIGRALEKNRAARYQRADDLQADLNALEQETYSAETPISRKHPAVSLRKLVLTLLAVAAAAALILTFRLFWPAYESQEPTVVSQLAMTNDGLRKFDLWGGVSGFPFTTDGPRIFFTEVIRGTRVIRQISSAGGDILPVPGIPDDGAFVPTDSDTRHSELLLTKLTNVCCQLWTTPMMGGSPRPLGDLVGREGVWSPDGQSIAYIGNDHGQDGCVYVARSDGSGPRLLVPPDSRVPSSKGLRWSPDGKHLRFTVLDPKANASSLWEVGVDGAGLHPLLPEWSRPGAECCGSWTANGKYFVFESQHDGHPNIWIAREGPAGMGKSPKPVRLTNGPLIYHTPVPSVDGKNIFVVGVQQSRGELVKYDPRTRRFERLLPGTSVGQLDYSRDGAWVAYTTYPDSILWRSRVDGSQRLQLTRPGIEAGVPRWSPDGKEIAFAARQPGQPWRIRTVTASGAHPGTSHGRSIPN